jgi:hypothetical protein
MIGLYQEASMVLITFDAAFVWGQKRTKLVLFKGGMINVPGCSKSLV